MIVSRLSTKWQTTVPRSVREALGVGPGDTLAYRIEGDQVFVSRARDGAEDGDDVDGDRTIRAAIDEILNDPHPLPSVPADEAFARVFAHIDRMRDERDAA
ncbi:MAG TPA: type II toxin-antitoxin system PrlF family antitoxin [Sphingomonadaceae bacterium]|nr:type II toxin-antitoxin system PrlF family antitoxin [Sphingomonadaceae bacterium]